jgi:hypothetical protein
MSIVKLLFLCIIFTLILFSLCKRHKYVEPNTSTNSAICDTSIKTIMEVSSSIDSASIFPTPNEYSDLLSGNIFLDSGFNISMIDFISEVAIIKPEDILGEGHIYQICDSAYAFSIRVGWQMTYTRGGIDRNEGLCLITRAGGKLVHILDVPILREHSVIYADSNNQYYPAEYEFVKNSIEVLKTRHNGYFDIKVISNDSSWEKVFTWDDTALIYSPIGENSY